MGSGDWFKTIISLKKGKKKSLKQPKEKESPALAESKSFIENNESGKDIASPNNDASVDSLVMPVEDRAAIKIQSAFRAYRARKTLRRLRGIVRLQTLTEKLSVKKQAANTLGYLHSWSKIQSNIQARRLRMVTEGRLKQKKLDNQLKLEAKLHDLEVEWCGGAETMDEVLARIHLREEAAVKRERAMAYAFNHQWRANSNPLHGSNANDLGKANWGWSWKERWIAARPWESRFPAQSPSPKKTLSRQGSKGSKVTPQQTRKQTSPLKPLASNGKPTPKPRRLSYPAAEKPSHQKAISSTEDTNGKNGSPEV